MSDGFVRDYKKSMEIELSKRSDHKVDIPEGTKGPWEIRKFEVTKDGAEQFNLQCLFSGAGSRGIVPGTYTKLLRHPHEGSPGALVMSDTPAEIDDHREFIRNATGRVLIHGLGLGMCVQAALEKECVEHVLVVEKSQDLIDLVAPHYYKKYGHALEIVQGDAFTWKPKPNTRWNVVWHDIWNSISVDNLPEMSKLHRRFGSRSDWQGSWCHYQCKRMREAERNPFTRLSL